MKISRPLKKLDLPLERWENLENSQNIQINV